MLRSTSSPAMGGISKMKLQLETLNLDNESRNSSFVRSKSQLRSQPQSSTGTNTSDGYSDDDTSDITNTSDGYSDDDTS